MAVDLHKGIFRSNAITVVKEMLQVGQVLNTQRLGQTNLANDPLVLMGAQERPNLLQVLGCLLYTSRCV